MSKKKLSYKQLVDAIHGIDIEEGDSVLIHNKLDSIGALDIGNDREQILQFYLSAFQEVLGDKGTILVFTAFYKYARYGIPFILEESPAETGVFSEYVRTHPKSIRSLHPIFSVTALGARANEFCAGPHYEAYGYDSPLGRMHRANVKMVSLGAGGYTFVHYIESVYGVPHQYTKIYNTPVYANGVEVPGPFTMMNRYLDFSIEPDDKDFKKILYDLNLIKELPLGRSSISVAEAQPVFDAGIQALSENRYFFLKEPPKFRNGEYPADGLTGDKQAVYHSPRKIFI